MITPSVIVWEFLKILFPLLKSTHRPTPNATRPRVSTKYCKHVLRQKQQSKANHKNFKGWFALLCSPSRWPCFCHSSCNCFYFAPRCIIYGFCTREEKTGAKTVVAPHFLRPCAAWPAAWLSWFLPCRPFPSNPQKPRQPLA